jgi:hypothetical protein
MFFLAWCVKCVVMQYPCHTISCSRKITIWINAWCQDQRIISDWSDLWVKENWQLYRLQLWIYSRNKNDMHAVNLLSCGVNGDTVSVSSFQFCSINVSVGIMYICSQKKLIQFVTVKYVIYHIWKEHSVERETAKKPIDTKWRVQQDATI